MWRRVFRSDKTYSVFQFAGADAYEEDVGLSFEKAVARADSLHRKTRRRVKVFDEDLLAKTPYSFPRASYVAR